jgi:hypothetical protein
MFAANPQINPKSQKKAQNKFDDLVKSPKSLFFVIPAKAGIQYFHRVTKNPDPVFQRGDDFLRDRQI